MREAAKKNYLVNTGKDYVEVAKTAKSFKKYYIGFQNRQPKLSITDDFSNI